MTAASLAARKCFVLITGEYPPMPGGVADYTFSVAQALAAAGDEVHVLCPGTPMSTPGVKCHGVGGRFGAADRKRADGVLARLPKERILLVEYVPHMYGMKGMNVGFAWWLWGKRRSEKIWVMFHEVAFPWSSNPLAKTNLIALANRVMVRLLTGAAERVMVSTTEWTKMVGGPAEVIPIPSNVPTVRDDAAAKAVRAKLGLRGDDVLVGHFGTYGRLVLAVLEPVLRQLLVAEPGIKILLLGRGGDGFVKSMVAQGVDGAGRLSAPGAMESDVLASHLVACDLVVQPYMDGATTRRTSLMASLALGVPAVTTLGPLVDQILIDSQAMVLAEPEVGAIVEAVRILLNDPGERSRLAARSPAFYQAEWSLERTIRSLRDRV